MSLPGRRACTKISDWDASSLVAARLGCKKPISKSKLVPLVLVSVAFLERSFLQIADQHVAVSACLLGPASPASGGCGIGHSRAAISGRRVVCGTGL